jgi:hypothetical protein
MGRATASSVRGVCQAGAWATPGPLEAMNLGEREVRELRRVDDTLKPRALFSRGNSIAEGLRCRIPAPAQARRMPRYPKSARGIGLKHRMQRGFESHSGHRYDRVSLLNRIS